MINKLEKLKAFDLERKVICSVLSIELSSLNGRNLGNVELNNGLVTFYKNYTKGDCVLLEFTGYQDSDKEDIYDSDILVGDDIIYLVQWNQNQTSWWLSPIQSRSGVDEMIYVIDNQTLGNGYLSRRDLTKIGNKYTHAHLL